VISDRESYLACFLASQKLTGILKTVHNYLLKLVNESGEIRVFMHHLILFYYFHNRGVVETCNFHQIITLVFFFINW